MLVIKAINKEVQLCPKKMELVLHGGVAQVQEEVSVEEEKEREEWAVDVQELDLAVSAFAPVAVRGCLIKLECLATT
jgi:hypothetical protein